MVVAKQTGIIPPSITQETLIDGLKVAFTAAGYGLPYAEFDNSTDKNLVYQIVNDPDKTFGTVYLQVIVNIDRAISQRLHTSFNTSTNTGPNAGFYSSAFDFSQDLQDGLPVGWMALNGGSELKWVVLHQGMVRMYLGVMRPAGMPDYWDENVAPYAIVSDVNYQPLQAFYMADVSPYWNKPDIRSGLFNLSVPRSRNPFDGQVDIVSRILFWPDSEEGVFGMSSGDLAQASDQNLEIGDTIALADGKEFLVIGGNGSAAVLTVRTA